MAGDSSQREVQVASERVFQGRILGVRVDTVRLPDGRETTREVLEHRAVVVIVPIDADDNVVMVRQFRYPTGESLLELPAGIVEEGEEPLAAAQRELQEETGWGAGEMREVARFWASPGHSNELMYAYVARNLEPGRLTPDDDENIETELLPLGRVHDAVRTGEVSDSKSIAGLLMATCL